MDAADNAWSPKGVEWLEDAAWAALKAGSASVTAGPGSGKSEFLAQRASLLFETGRCPYPQQILAISFKRSAASNLRDRVRTRLPDYGGRFTSMTFDAFTKMIVDRFANLLPVPWRLAGSYRIGYASRREIESFLDDVSAAAPPSFQDGLRAIRSNDFISKHVGATALGVHLASPASAEEHAVQAWWSLKFIGRTLPTLDFVMINKLAELIVRSSPQLRVAIAATYPFVFVDEFQDTTFAQYSFLSTVFAGTETEVTVVGDKNQRIMGWAGALEDAFDEFEADFRAQSFSLTSNFRSSEQLVELQHRFATILSPGASRQISQVLSETGDAPAQVWSFPTSQAEASTVAAWVREDMEDSGRVASDYAILARQKVAEMEARFRVAFQAHELRIRNDDALIGEMRLQDLLGDDLTALFIDTVRLAASAGGQPDAWISVTSSLTALRHPAVEQPQSWEERLNAYLADLRDWFASIPLREDANRGATELAGQLIERFTAFISVEELGSGRHFAETVEEVAMKLTSIGLRLASVLDEAESWSGVADAFREEDAVPIMTIHRSKGLEYHTVFIVGLDDEQWWSHASNSIESTMTFFVGVSRAAERIVFTHRTQGVARRKIRDLYAELERAGVPFLEMD